MDTPRTALSFFYEVRRTNAFSTVSTIDNFHQTLLASISTEGSQGYFNLDCGRTTSLSDSIEKAFMVKIKPYLLIDDISCGHMGFETLRHRWSIEHN